MSWPAFACYIFFGLLFLFMYGTITYRILQESKKLKHGGKVRPIVLMFVWPFALACMVLAILAIRRDPTGPTDQVTLDDVLMFALMRRYPQARVQKFIRGARRRNRLLLDTLRDHHQLSRDLGEERRKRRILVRLKAAQVAVSAVNNCIEEAVEDVSEEIRKKVLERVHSRFQEDLKLDIEPIDTTA